MWLMQKVIVVIIIDRAMAIGRKIFSSTWNKDEIREHA